MDKLSHCLLGHIISRGTLSPRAYNSGARCLRGILSPGQNVSGHIVSGGTLSLGRIVLGHIVLGSDVWGHIVLGHHVPPPKKIPTITIFWILYTFIGMNINI